MKASLTINIWTGEKTGLPADLSEAFVPHLEHLVHSCGEGNLAGEICDEGFSGWWNIAHDEASTINADLLAFIKQISKFTGPDKGGKVDADTLRGLIKRAKSLVSKSEG